MKFLSVNCKIDILFSGFCCLLLLLLLTANPNYLKSYMVDHLRNFCNEKFIKPTELAIIICFIKFDCTYCPLLLVGKLLICITRVESILSDV